MADKQNNNSREPKLLDVRHPGKSAPSAHSKPVIVGNKPMVQDPMVSGGKQEDTPEMAINVRREGHKVIVPLSDTGQKASVDKAQTDKEDKPEEPPAPAPADAPRQEATAPQNPASNNSSSVVDAVIDQAAREKDNKNSTEKLELEQRQAEAEGLIREKKYFVPIAETVKKRRKTRWVVLLLVFILLAGGYLALDAQVVRNDIQLPYEFFRQERQPEEPVGAAIPAGGQSQSITNTAGNEPLSQSQIKARDSSRKSELLALRSKMVEFASNNNGLYPTEDNWQAAIKATTEETTGPKDESYIYTTDQGRDYSLKAELENRNDPDAEDGYFIVRSTNQ